MKVRQVAEANLPTKFGTFRLFGFEGVSTSENVFALVMGDPAAVPADDQDALRTQIGEGPDTDPGGLTGHGNLPFRKHMLSKHPTTPGPFRKRESATVRSSGDEAPTGPDAQGTPRFRWRADHRLGPV